MVHSHHGQPSPIGWAFPFPGHPPFSFGQDEEESATPLRRLVFELDLGRVGEAASVLVNGKEVGWALWAPYRIVTGKDAWVQGDNVLEVRVTNTAANAYEGALYPSGLMGPGRLPLAVPRS